MWFLARAQIPDPPGRRQTRSIRLTGRAEVSADQPPGTGETESAADRVDDLNPRTLTEFLNLWGAQTRSPRKCARSGPTSQSSRSPAWAEPTDGQPLSFSASSVSCLSTRLCLQIGMIRRREQGLGTAHPPGLRRSRQGHHDLARNEPHLPGRLPAQIAGPLSPTRRRNRRRSRRRSRATRSGRGRHAEPFDGNRTVRAAPGELLRLGLKRAVPSLREVEREAAHGPTDEPASVAPEQTEVIAVVQQGQVFQLKSRIRKPRFGPWAERDGAYEGCHARSSGAVPGPPAPVTRPRRLGVPVKSVSATSP
jgi:hypothetical protein